MHIAPLCLPLVPGAPLREGGKTGEGLTELSVDYGWDKYCNVLLHTVLCPQVQ